MIRSTSTSARKAIGRRGPAAGAAAVMALALLLLPSAQGQEAAGQGDTMIKFDGLRIPYQEAVILVAPGARNELVFDAQAKGLTATVKECLPDAGRCTFDGSALAWTAPEKSGDYWVKVKLAFRAGRGGLRQTVDEQTEWIQFAGLVGYPSSLLHDGFLNGFELGRYPDYTQMKKPDYYKPPEYFWYLTYDVLGLSLSEHIKLGDLGYDGRAPIPQYFTLRRDLVKKLEAIKSELVARGLPSRFHYIGGGFISPKSNLERTAKDSAAADLSRHMWGEAIDLVIDEQPRDGAMDDLNRDGRVDVRDAIYLRELTASLEDQGKCVIGGFGVYAPPRNSAIQTHIDVRGFRMYWGVKEYDPQEFAGAPVKKSLRPVGKADFNGKSGRPGKDEKSAKDSKSGKSSKDAKSGKSSKDAKAGKSTKDAKTGKDAKSTKSTKSTSSTKPAGKDKNAKSTKPATNTKSAKSTKPASNDKNSKSAKSTKPTSGKTGKGHRP